jgi:hypothetical protein
MADGPIKLTIYNTDSEPVKELQTSIIPWGIMKRAIKLVKSLKVSENMSQAELLEALNDEAIDTMTALVVDVFAGKVTVEELNRGVELGEMLPVIMAIIRKAFSGMGGNPT